VDQEAAAATATAGEHCAASPRGRTAKFVGQKLQELHALVDRAPDMTLQELLAQSGVDGSIMAVHRALERLGCHRKKSRSMPPSEIDRT
jgi:transposase